MIKAWFIIILLFLGAAAGILEWLADFEPYYSFKSGAKVGRATAASKLQKPGSAIVKFDEARYEFPLRFKTEAGKDIFVVAYVPRRALDKLEQDGYVNVLYLPDEPRRIVFEGDIPRMPKGYMGLLFGLVSLAVGIAAMKARHSLARHTRYLGHGDNDVGSG
jgi:hypothetical protein